MKTTINNNNPKNPEPVYVLRNGKKRLVPFSSSDSYFLNKLDPSTLSMIPHDSQITQTTMNKHGVSIRELIDDFPNDPFPNVGPLQSVFLTTFVIDEHFLISDLLNRAIGRRIPVTYVVHPNFDDDEIMDFHSKSYLSHCYDHKVDCAERFHFTKPIAESNDRDNLHRICATHYLPLLTVSTQYKTWHPKMYLLFYEKMLRIVVSSSNVDIVSYNQIGQTFWWIDLPLLSTKIRLADASSSRPSSISNTAMGFDFYKTLRSFIIYSIGPFLSSEYHFLSNLDNFDFSEANQPLILTLSGKFPEIGRDFILIDNIRKKYATFDKNSNFVKLLDSWVSIGKHTSIMTPIKNGPLKHTKQNLDSIFCTNGKVEIKRPKPKSNLVSNPFLVGYFGISSSLTISIPSTETSGHQNTTPIGFLNTGSGIRSLGTSLGPLMDAGLVRLTNARFLNFPKKTKEKFKAPSFRGKIVSSTSIEVGFQVETCPISFLFKYFNVNPVDDNASNKNYTLVSVDSDISIIEPIHNTNTTKSESEAPPESLTITSTLPELDTKPINLSEPLANSLHRLGLFHCIPTDRPPSQLEYTRFWIGLVHILLHDINRATLYGIDQDIATSLLQFEVLFANEYGLASIQRHLSMIPLASREFTDLPNVSSSKLSVIASSMGKLNLILKSIESSFTPTFFRYTSTPSPYSQSEFSLPLTFLCENHCLQLQKQTAAFLPSNNTTTKNRRSAPKHSIPIQFFWPPVSYLNKYDPTYFGHYCASQTSIPPDTNIFYKPQSSIIGRPWVPDHTKLICRQITFPSTYLPKILFPTEQQTLSSTPTTCSTNIIYTGSHNLSTAAWGSISTKKYNGSQFSAFHGKNVELGVLFLDIKIPNFHISKATLANLFTSFKPSQSLMQFPYTGESFSNEKPVTSQLIESLIVQKQVIQQSFQAQQTGMTPQNAQNPGQGSIDPSIMSMIFTALMNGQGNGISGTDTQPVVLQSARTKRRSDSSLDPDPKRKK